MGFPVEIPAGFDTDKPIIIITRLKVKEEKWHLFEQILAELSEVAKTYTLALQSGRSPAKDGVIEFVGWREFTNGAAIKSHFEGRGGDIIQKAMASDLAAPAIPEFLQDLKHFN